MPRHRPLEVSRCCWLLSLLIRLHRSKHRLPMAGRLLALPLQQQLQCRAQRLRSILNRFNLTPSRFSACAMHSDIVGWQRSEEREPSFMKGSLLLTSRHQVKSQFRLGRALSPCLGQLDHVHRRRIAALPALREAAHFQTVVSAVGGWLRAGGSRQRLAPMALDLKPAEPAVEALPNRRRRLHELAATLHTRSSDDRIPARSVRRDVLR